MMPYVLPLVVVGGLIGIWIQEKYNQLAMEITIVLVIGAVLILWGKYKGWKIIGIVLFLVALLCGMAVHGHEQKEYEALSHEIVGSSGIGKGTVTEVKVYDQPEGASYLVALHEWKGGHAPSQAVDGAVRVYVKGKEQDSIKVGDEVLVKGMVDEPSYYQNEGMYDFPHRDKKEQVIGRLYGKGPAIQRIEDSRSSWFTFFQYREELEQLYLRHLEPQSAYILSSLLFGGHYEQIDPMILQAFSRTGLIHILSVSGSHMALIMGIAAYLGRRVRLRGNLLWLFGTMMILLYMGMADFEAPVVRAGIMGLISFTAVAIRKQYSGLHALALAVGGMMIWNSYTLFDLGFQLSTGASLGILLFYRPLRYRFRHLPFGLHDIVAIVVSAHLLIVPLLWRNFQMMPLYTIPANLVSGFLLDSLIASGIVLAAPFLLLPAEFTHVVLQAMDGVLHTAVLSNQAMANLPYAVINVPPLQWEWEVAYYCLIFLYLPERKDWRPWLQWVRRLGFVLLGFSLVLGAYYWYTKRDWYAYRLDVGTGTAVAWANEEGQQGLYYYMNGLVQPEYMVKGVLLPSLRYHGFFSFDSVYVRAPEKYKDEIERIKEELAPYVKKDGGLYLALGKENRFVIGDGHISYRIGTFAGKKGESFLWESNGMDVKEKPDGLKAIVYNSDKRKEGSYVASAWHIPAYDVAKGELMLYPSSADVEVYQYIGES